MTDGEKYVYMVYSYSYECDTLLALCDTQEKAKKIRQQLAKTSIDLYPHENTYIERQPLNVCLVSLTI